MAQANKRALLNSFGVEEPEIDTPGTMNMEPQPIPGIAGPVNSTPKPSTPVSTEAASPSTPPASSPVFQSQNASTRGYLDEAMRSFAPTVKGIADEAGRKSAVENYLRSLEPEIAKRGGSLSDIRGEKARVDGRMIDFYRDIEGAADPQYLDVTDEGPAGGGMVGGLDASLTGDPTAAIQEALAKLGNSPNLQALLAQLGGA